MCFKSDFMGSGFEKLRNCLLRFALWTSEVEMASKGEMNDLEMAKENLIKELRGLLDDIGD